MSTLVDTWDAWITVLETIPNVHVYPHGGSFTKSELKRHSRQAPALLLTLLRFDPIVQGGIITSEARWGLIAITKDSSTKDRHRTCIALAELAAAKILLSFGGQNAGGAVSRGKDLAAKNLFGTELDGEANIAMWGIEFVQTLDLTVEILTAQWTKFALTWDLAPRDEAAGEDPPNDPHEPEVGEIPEAEDEVDPSA